VRKREAEKILIIEVFLSFFWVKKGKKKNTRKKYKRPKRRRYMCI